MRDLHWRALLLLAGVVAGLAAAGFASPSTASAHRDGCHRWHSCPSDTGSYVCGDLGYTSECPAVPPTPAPPPPPADTDGDGVLDTVDGCPAVAAATPTGCPDPDTDGDGISDSTDKCPSVAAATADGCPPPAPTYFLSLSAASTQAKSYVRRRRHAQRPTATCKREAPETVVCTVRWRSKGQRRSLSVDVWRDADGYNVQNH
jgi:hypothetical protein